MSTHNSSLFIGDYVLLGCCVQLDIVNLYHAPLHWPLQKETPQHRRVPHHRRTLWCKHCKHFWRDSTALGLQVSHRQPYCCSISTLYCHMLWSRGYSLSVDRGGQFSTVVSHTRDKIDSLIIKSACDKSSFVCLRDRYFSLLWTAYGKEVCKMFCLLCKCIHDIVFYVYISWEFLHCRFSLNTYKFFDV